MWIFDCTRGWCSNPPCCSRSAVLLFDQTLYSCCVFLGGTVGSPIQGPEWRQQAQRPGTCGWMDLLHCKTSGFEVEMEHAPLKTIRRIEKDVVSLKSLFLVWHVGRCACRSNQDLIPDPTYPRALGLTRSQKRNALNACWRDSSQPIRFKGGGLSTKYKNPQCSYFWITSFYNQLWELSLLAFLSKGPQKTYVMI